MPRGIGTIMKMLLPFNLSRFESEDFNSVHMKTKFSIGIKKLQHKKLNEILDHVIKKGDPIFKIEFLYNNSPEINFLKKNLYFTLVI